MIYRLKQSFLTVFIMLFLLILSSTVWSKPASPLEKSTVNLIKHSHNLSLEKKISTLKMNQLKMAAESRRDILLQELQNHSSDIEKNLLPAQISTLFPSQIQSYIEKEINNIKGVIEINVADDFKNHETTEYIFKADAGTVYKLYFLNKPNSKLKTGAHIKIMHAYKMSFTKGHNDLIVSSDEVVILKDLTIKAIPTSFGPQKTIVILTNFQDQPNNIPFTPADVSTSVFTNLSNKYFEFSYHQTTVVGNVVGWFTVGMNSTDTCDNLLNNLGGYATSAATASGVDLTQYTHQVIIFPNFADCSWGGYSSIGGDPSVSFINGSDSSDIISHEMGHALGLMHSHSLECNGTTNTGTCTLNEYGNLADAMGNPWNYHGPHFNSYQKERLGWLNYQISPPLQTITTSGTYNIDAYETLNNNVKALKILKSIATDGSNNYYYLEFRQGIGQDLSIGSCSSSCDYTRGVLITQANDADINSSQLLDMSPTDNNHLLTTLLPGMSFNDPSAPNGGLTITTNSVSSAGANVTVTLGNAPVCVRSPHTLSLTPTSTQNVQAGGSADYTLTLTNNDSAACGASNFTLLSSGQMSWILPHLSAQSVTIAPGLSSTIILTVKASTAAPINLYSIYVSGTNTSVAGTQIATVNASLGVTA